MIRTVMKIIIVLFIVLPFTGCFDYTLKVGTVGVKNIFSKEQKDNKAKKQLKRYPKKYTDPYQFKHPLRSRPDRWAPIRLFLKKGTMVTPLKYFKSWYYIKTPRGVYGWVFQGDVYRVPVWKAIYDIGYKSDDNHAVILTVPLLIIVVCLLLYLNNRFTRTIVPVLLMLQILASTSYFAGYYMNRFRRYVSPYKIIGEYLKDKKSYVYVTDFILSKNINFFSGYTKNFSYYYSSKKPGYNRNSKIIMLTDKFNVHAIHGAYVVVDPGNYYRVTGWGLPSFAKTGVFPGNWSKVMHVGSVMLFWAR